MSVVEALRARLRTLAAPDRAGRFVSVGVVGAVCDNAVSVTLNEAGVLPELAAFVGIETAVVVMFLLNDAWTFDDEGRGGLGPWLRRLATSNLVRAGGIGVQLGVFWVVYRPLFRPLVVAGVDAWFVVAKGSGILVGMVVNYAAESLLTWRVHARN